METALPDRNGIATHRQVRAYGHELLRRNVVEAADQLLREEGSDALTVRRVAEKLDCSTKIIYTMFKGKDGLNEALYLEGCSNLAQAIACVPKAETPAAYLRAVAFSYWTFALANPEYYLVMFGGAIPHYQPSATSIHATATVFEIIVEVLQSYRQEQTLDELALLTQTLWAALHGAVSLHLLGYVANREDANIVFERTVDAIIAPLTSTT
jgi:AcrR family transcriptional regulator